MQEWIHLEVIQFFIVSVVGFGLLIFIPVDAQISNKSYEFEMCVASLEYVEHKGSEGTIFYDKFNEITKVTTSYGCELTLKTCRDCKISISVANKFQYDTCSYYWEYSSQCIIGCTYLMIYEPYYPEDTSLIYHKSDDNRGTFTSVSNAVNIKFCFSRSSFLGPGFRLKFEILPKEEVIRSSSGHFYSRGLLSTPFFPNHYATKDEIYTYTFQSVNHNDRIQLIFNDWNLSPSSQLTFANSNIDSKIFKGMDYRPAVVSRSNYLTMTFRTGRPSQLSGYMGFNLTYIFGFDRTVVVPPRTDCGGFYTTSEGGLLTLEIRSIYTYEQYDCIWVVKKMKNYDGLFFRMVQLQTNTRAPQFQIRNGLTSHAPLLYSYPLQRKEVAQMGFDSSSGAFYIRLKGYISKEDVIKLTYVSYKSSYLCQHTEWINCGSDQCINKKFKCDGEAQCPSRKDEDSSECTPSSNSDGYEYTISISIIIPLVVSVFVVIIVCLLAMFIHRCRKVSQHRSGSRSTSRSGGRHQRRRGRRSQIQMNLTINDDSPPSYEEVIRSAPIGYLNRGFPFNQPDDMPSLPTYAEAIGSSMSDSMILSASSLQNSGRSNNSSRSVITDSEDQTQDALLNDRSRHSYIPEQRNRSGSNVSRQSDSNVNHSSTTHNSQKRNIPSKTEIEIPPYGPNDQVLPETTSVSIYNSSSNSLEVVNNDSHQVVTSPVQKHSKHNRKNKSRKTPSQSALEGIPNSETVVPRGEDLSVSDSTLAVEPSQNSSAQNRRKKKKVPTATLR